MAEFQFDVQDLGVTPAAILVKLDGKVDYQTEPLLQEHFDRIMKNGVRRFLLDMKDVSYVNSQGLGFFMHLAAQLRAQGGRLALVRVSPMVKLVVRRMRLDVYIDIVESVEEGLYQMSQAAAEVSDRARVAGAEPARAAQPRAEVATAAAPSPAPPAAPERPSSPAPTARELAAPPPPVAPSRPKPVARSLPIPPVPAMAAATESAAPATAVAPTAEATPAGPAAPSAAPAAAETTATVRKSPALPAPTGPTGTRRVPPPTSTSPAPSEATAGSEPLGSASGLAQGKLPRGAAGTAPAAVPDPSAPAPAPAPTTRATRSTRASRAAAPADPLAARAIPSVPVRTGATTRTAIAPPPPHPFLDAVAWFDRAYGAGLAALGWWLLIRRALATESGPGVLEGVSLLFFAALFFLVAHGFARLPLWARLGQLASILFCFVPVLVSMRTGVVFKVPPEHPLPILLLVLAAIIYSVFTLYVLIESWEADAPRRA